MSGSGNGEIAGGKGHSAWLCGRTALVRKEPMQPAGNDACSLNLADTLLQCLGKPVLRRTWFAAEYVVYHREVIASRGKSVNHLFGNVDLVVARAYSLPATLHASTCTTTR